MNNKKESKKAERKLFSFLTFFFQESGKEDRKSPINSKWTDEYSCKEGGMLKESSVCYTWYVQLAKFGIIKALQLCKDFHLYVGKTFSSENGFAQ